MPAEQYDFVFNALRAEDGLVLRVRLERFLFRTETEVESIAASSRVVLELPPQHLAEEAQAFDPSHPDAGPKPGVFASRAAHPTRLVFTVPSRRVTPITLRAVLELCQAGELVSSSTPGSLTPSDSAIELVFHLVLALPARTMWSLTPVPVMHQVSGRNELWTAAPRTAPVIARAHALPDAPQDAAFVETTPMLLRHRQAIAAALTTPRTAKTLLLSSLGGWLEIDAALASQDIARWEHLTTMGRDQRVRIEEPGFLYPTGHRADHVTLSVRKIATRDGAPIAYLEKRFYVVVRDPMVPIALPADDADVSGAGNPAKIGRAARSLALRELHATSPASPALDPENEDRIPIPELARWVRVRREHHRFPMRAKDADERAVDIPVPVIFVSDRANASATAMSRIKALYEESALKTWRLGSQRMSLARSTAASSVAVPVVSMTIGMEDLGPPAPPPAVPVPSFHARVDEATVRLPDVEGMLSRARDVASDAALMATLRDESTRLAATLHYRVDRALQTAADVTRALAAAVATGPVHAGLVRALAHVDAASALRSEWDRHGYARALQTATAIATRLRLANPELVAALRDAQTTPWLIRVEDALHEVEHVERAIAGARARLQELDDELGQALDTAVLDRLAASFSLGADRTRLETLAAAAVAQHRAAMNAAAASLATAERDVRAEVDRCRVALQDLRRRYNDATTMALNDCAVARATLREAALAKLLSLVAVAEQARHDVGDAIRPVGALDELLGLGAADLADLRVRAAALAAFPGPSQVLESLSDVCSSLRGIRLGIAVRHPEEYVRRGFAALENPKQVFLELVGRPLGVAFDTARVGGLVAPDLSISGLSRVLGAWSGSRASLFTSDFDPKDYFPSHAKIFGVVPLAHVLKKLEAAARDVVPTLERLPDRIVYTWETRELQRVGPFVPRAAARLHLRIEVGVRDGGTFDSATTLESFTLGLWNVIELDFDHVSFRSRGHGSPTVYVSVTDVRLRGQLAFFGELQNALKKITGDAGLVLERPSAAVLRAGLRLSVPSLGLGMFSLQDLRLTTEVDLSLRGDPIVVRFKVSEPDSPFIISVALLAGGGYVLLEVDSGGVKRLEAALEFGAALSFSLGGLASGRVYAMGGVRLELQRGSATVTGYFRMGGHVKVLGIVSVSIVFYLGLRYDGSALTGTATVYVNVKIAFFSVEVKLTVTKRLAGSARAAAPGVLGVVPPLAAADTPRVRLSEVLDLGAFERYRHAFHRA